MISLRNGLNVDRMSIRRHAQHRAIVRFNRASKKDARGYIRSTLRNAVFVGETTCDKGNPGLLFAYHRHGIVVSPDRREVITVIKLESVTYEPLKAQVRELHAKEYRKFDRKERALRKRLELIKAEADVEIAELRLMALKTNSIPRRLACKARINAINEYIRELEEEIKEITDEKRRVTKSQASVM